MVRLLSGICLVPRAPPGYSHPWGGGGGTAKGTSLASGHPPAWCFLQARAYPQRTERGQGLGSTAPRSQPASFPAGSAHGVPVGTEDGGHSPLPRAGLTAFRSHLHSREGTWSVALAWGLPMTLRPWQALPPLRPRPRGQGAAPIRDQGGAHGMWPWRGRWGQARCRAPSTPPLAPLVSHPDSSPEAPAWGGAAGAATGSPKRAACPQGPGSLWGLHPCFWGGPGHSTRRGVPSQGGHSRGWQQAGPPLKAPETPGGGDSAPAGCWGGRPG